MFDWRDYGNGIVAFDAGYVRPVLAAIHLVIENGRVAFIGYRSNDALPNAWPHYANWAWMQPLSIM